MSSSSHAGRTYGIPSLSLTSGTLITTWRHSRVQERGEGCGGRVPTTGPWSWGKVASGGGCVGSAAHRTRHRNIHGRRTWAPTNTTNADATQCRPSRPANNHPPWSHVPLPWAFPSTLVRFHRKSSGGRDAFRYRYGPQKPPEIPIDKKISGG